MRSRPSYRTCLINNSYRHLLERICIHHPPPKERRRGEENTSVLLPSRPDRAGSGFAPDPRGGSAASQAPNLSNLIPCCFLASRMFSKRRMENYRCLSTAGPCGCSEILAPWYSSQCCSTCSSASLASPEIIFQISFQGYLPSDIP